MSRRIPIWLLPALSAIVAAIAIVSLATAGAAGTGGARLAQVGSFNSPVSVAAPPRDPNRVFVVEQGGKIWELMRGVKQRRPFLDLGNRVVSGGEQGLLSMAFAPDYARSHRFYVYYTATAPTVGHDRRHRGRPDPRPLADPRQPRHAQARADDPPPRRVQPQRRPAPVRPRQQALHRHRRWRGRRRHPGQRPEPDQVQPVGQQLAAAGQDPARLAQARRRLQRVPATTRSTARRRRSGCSDCATRGATRSTARPATW